MEEDAGDKKMLVTGGRILRVVPEGRSEERGPGSEE
jgi:hypothetical protein